MNVAARKKTPKKGAKQIQNENDATLNFYRNMALSSFLINLLIKCFTSEFTVSLIVLYVLAFGVLFGSYTFMKAITQSSVSETGAIVDTGGDLNMEGGVAEHVKDLVILTSGTLLLVTISGYFWFLLLIAPVRLLWLLWGSVLKPWLSTENAEDVITDEKKQKKMERKVKRLK